uniref:DUF6824 domain-containing protein n=1 Tax=Craspedostauros australis TaxID=1486917 RepID=A0A7R9WZZ2_9STRA|mmetsp:Transcript_4422/g.11597  ORF Transcript_4422/g.11597 Transcript_4422/m.11597 type:complete len:449 (+) Transcript_4422:171-1517(+)
MKPTCDSDEEKHSAAMTDARPDPDEGVMPPPTVKVSTKRRAKTKIFLKFFALDNPTRPSRQIVVPCDIGKNAQWRNWFRKQKETILESPQRARPDAPKVYDGDSKLTISPPIAINDAQRWGHASDSDKDRTPCEHEGGALIDCPKDLEDFMVEQMDREKEEETKVTQHEDNRLQDEVNPGVTTSVPHSIRKKSCGSATKPEDDADDASMMSDGKRTADLNEEDTIALTESASSCGIYGAEEIPGDDASDVIHLEFAVNDDDDDDGSADDDVDTSECNSDIDMDDCTSSEDTDDYDDMTDEEGQVSSDITDSDTVESDNSNDNNVMNDSAAPYTYYSETNDMDDDWEEAIVTPHHNDVLNGRGGQSRNHPGNKDYIMYTFSMFRYYEQLKSDAERTRMQKAVIERTHNMGGRFLKMRSGRWVEQDAKAAREKVSQRFRTLRSHVKRHGG